MKQDSNKNKSYRQILRSTTIMGGASALNIVMRIVKTKVLAILLGPSGVGLIGIFTSITDMVGAIARVGTDNSGMRRTAILACSDNQEDISVIFFCVRCISLILGITGMLLLVLGSDFICKLTFGNTTYIYDVMLISCVVLLEMITSGEIVRIQGLRRIGDLARINVFSAFLGSILSLPLLFILGKNGVVPFFITSSAVNTLIAIYYSKNINVKHINIKFERFLSEVRPLLKLGSVFMVGDLMAKGTIYIIRLFVIRKTGLEAVGIYQAAVVLSSIYVGFILDSMIKDYYPRLTAIGDDDVKFNELVNQQVYVGIVLSAPGILATLTFAPLIIKVFYTAKFVSAYEILCWQVLGILFQVACWPITFILQAKGLGRLFIVTEMIRNVLYAGLVWLCLEWFGLNGSGIAFFVTYVCYLIVISLVSRKKTGYVLSRENVRLLAIFIPIMSVVFLNRYLLKNGVCLIINSIITAMATIYSINSLINIISPNGIFTILDRIKTSLNRSMKVKEHS